MVLFLTMIERKNTALNLTKERTMAEVDTTQLSQEHGAIRHDVAVESARLGGQLGSEACMINKHIGDARRESANYAADIRYDVATRAGDIRKEVADAACGLSKEVGAGFADTRYNIATTAGDIRREQQAGFGQTRVDIADAKDVLNDSIRVEGGQTRSQSAAETSEVIKEGLKGDFHTRGDIKDTRFDLADRVGNSEDKLADRILDLRALVGERFMTVARDTMEVRAQVTGLGQQVRDGFVSAAKDMEVQALKTQLDARSNTQYLADKIVNDGEKTRALMNDLKYHDLNRALVERQTALVNCEQDNRHWGHRYDDARWNQMQGQWGTQFAAMQSQLQSMSQNFNSQLSEARQGMVNFGTMAGVGQTSTNNNVR
jgi:hypothetical protein